MTPSHVRPTLSWNEAEQSHSAEWRSEAGTPVPTRVIVGDDTLPADNAWRLACEGTAILWRGDFQNARHLMLAMMRRVDRAPRTGSAKARRKGVRTEAPPAPGSAFHLHRQAQSQRARTLGMVLVPVAGDYTIPLRRAPDWQAALTEAWGPATGAPAVVSLRELLGLVGAHEWRKKGVDIPALGLPGNNRIHPYYGVFAPTRSEYIELVARAPLPSTELAFDIGVGTGVLSAVLARRGVRRIVATDNDPRAIACARENLARLGVGAQVELVETDMFPAGQAPLVVCNPPWLPARPSSPLERAIYDEGSRMLRAFLGGLRAHLTPGGEGWLVLSDLAEHLGLRTREQLTEWIGSAGLAVLERRDIRPRHGKVLDASDPLHAARVAEVTSLWRLRVAAPD